MRWPERLPQHADAGGPAPAPGPGAAHPADLPRPPGAGGGPGRRHGPVRWRPAPGKGPAAGDGALQGNPPDRPRRPLRPAPARGAQPGDLPGRRALGPVLRSRPLFADRLFDWRQCRGKRRRRALPEIRPDRAQPAQGPDAQRRGPAPDPGQRGPGRAGLRPAGAVHRLRRPAGGDHRNHGQATAQAADRQGAAGGLRLSGSPPAAPWPTSLPRASSPAAWR